MELRATRELRRNEQLSKTTVKKADASAKPQAQPARTQAPKDKVSLSRQALAYFETQDQIRQAQERQRQADKDGDQSLDLLKEGLDVMKKCLKIASSIRKGDNVPPEDLEYLQNNDPAGYLLALSQRREKEHPEEVESVLDDGDKNGGGESPAESGGGAAPAPAE